MLLLVAALVIVACSRAPAPPAADPESLRHPPAGDVVGFVSAYGSHAWRGIPYAEPPVGEQVVVVAVNHRLGPLGWFSHPALRGPGTSAPDQSGNYGTLDLARALEWVRENIAAIDADPRLADQRERCAVFLRLARWGRSFDAERYARAGARGCAEYPIAAYPWRDAADVAAGS